MRQRKQSEKINLIHSGFEFFSMASSQRKFDLSFQFDGRLREFIVSIPTKLPPVAGYPVVMMLHGTSGDKDVYYNAHGWRELGQQENFITIFPSSLRWCFYEDGLTKTIQNLYPAIFWRQFAHQILQSLSMISDF